MNGRRRWLVVALALQIGLMAWGIPQAFCAGASLPEGPVSARIAVATNFAQTAKDIAKAFQEEHATRIEIINGSTGKLYAQIQNGAPFDAFFAADANRPQLLEAQGKIIEGSRFTYALGTLVLWSPQATLIDDGPHVLGQGRFARLSLANPKLAPYGLAAQEVLEGLGLWDRLQGKIVIGQNIGQAYQFVHTANAELGFVALSQLQDPNDPNKPIAGSCWKVPPSMHKPIEQQAVRLNDNPAAEAFIEFLRTDKGRKIIEAYGYSVPRPKAKTESESGQEDLP